MRRTAALPLRQTVTRCRDPPHTARTLRPRACGCTRAYTANNASDTLSMYDLANPRAPREIRAVEPKGHGHPHQLAVDRNETFLYVVKHGTEIEMPVGDGSTVNVLRLAPDGDALEVGASPVTLAVRDDLLARPQGVVAL